MLNTNVAPPSRVLRRAILDERWAVSGDTAREFDTASRRSHYPSLAQAHVDRDLERIKDSSDSTNETDVPESF
jgi:hypothetical protein